MAFKQVQVTITAAAQQLGAGLSAADQAKGLRHAPVRSITFQLLKANSNDAFIGDENLTTSLYAFRIDPGDTAPPIVLGGHDEGAMKLDDFYVIGNAGDTLCVGVVFY
jgi:hypothetical protein